MFRGWKIQIFGFVLLVMTADGQAADPEGPLAVTRSGIWTIVESPNFRCVCQLNEVDARRLAGCCELWRSRLRTMWITEADSSDWSPKCEVTVHADKAAYNRALNRPGDSSVGSTMMNFDHGRAVLRRIDLRADASDWSNAALPHELTHVVLGERFGGHALPRWADEGIAMLSESADKHRERLSNLREILSRRQSLRISELVRTDRLPLPHLRDAFYGQSVGLTSWLVRRSSPARFADFVEHAQQAGIEAALKQHYRIDGLIGLQHEWDRWSSRPDSMEFVSLQLHLGVTPIVADAK